MLELRRSRNEKKTYGWKKTKLRGYLRGLLGGCSSAEKERREVRFNTRSFDLLGLAEAGGGLSVGTGALNSEGQELCYQRGEGFSPKGQEGPDWAVTRMLLGREQGLWFSGDAGEERVDKCCLAHGWTRLRRDEHRRNCYSGAGQIPAVTGRKGPTPQGCSAVKTCSKAGGTGHTSVHALLRPLHVLLTAHSGFTPGAL